MTTYINLWKNNQGSYDANQHDDDGEAVNEILHREGTNYAGTIEVRDGKGGIEVSFQQWDYRELVKESEEEERYIKYLKSPYLTGRI